MRVLVLSDNLPGYRSGFIDALHDHFDLLVACDPETPEGIPGLAFDSVNHLPLKALRVGRLLWLRGALGVIVRGKFDVLVLFSNARWPHVWLAAVLARMRGKSVFHWGHGWTGRERRLYGYIRRTLYSIGDGVLVFGEAARTIGVSRYGFPAERVHVIGNSLPWTDETKPLAVPPSERTKLIIVARLTAERRVDLLLHAVALLRDRHRDVEVTVIGHGAEGESLRQLSRRLRIDDRVSFVGQMFSEAELEKHYGQVSGCVLPGKVGLSAVQAAGYGCPVIRSSDVREHAPEFELVQDGHTGFVFSSGDAESLAQAITRLLDDPEWADMSIRARQEVEAKYSPSSQLSRFVRAMRTC